MCDAKQVEGTEAKIQIHIQENYSKKEEIGVADNINRIRAREREKERKRNNEYESQFQQKMFHQTIKNIKKYI